MHILTYLIRVSTSYYIFGTGQKVYSGGGGGRVVVLKATLVFIFGPRLGL